MGFSLSMSMLVSRRERSEAPVLSGTVVGVNTAALENYRCGGPEQNSQTKFLSSHTADADFSAAEFQRSATDSLVRPRRATSPGERTALADELMYIHPPVGYFLLPAHPGCSTASDGIAGRRRAGGIEQRLERGAWPRWRTARLKDNRGRKVNETLRRTSEAAGKECDLAPARK
ncbi:hypothetical protein DPEC_G00316810 [Dallia pectoralis]|uniref:Uncharacterized protein n=1 Tax=Dallia pectoralis TaxID=75939 RepID=A0ACC2FD04_DALPE|nr:hypothetical protein DPEC_G00316810 [Dallia pectoralis]